MHFLKYFDPISAVLFLIGRYPFVFHSNLQAISTNSHMTFYTASFQLITLILTSYNILYGGLIQVSSNMYTYIQHASMMVNFINLLLTYTIINVLGLWKTKSHRLAIRKLSANGIESKLLHEMFLSFCKFLGFLTIQFIVLVSCIFFVFVPVNVTVVSFRVSLWFLKLCIVLIIIYARGLIKLMTLQMRQLNSKLVAALSQKRLDMYEFWNIFDNFDRIEQSRGFISRSIGAQLLVILVFVFVQMSTTIFDAAITVLSEAQNFGKFNLYVIIIPLVGILFLLVDVLNQMGAEVNLRLKII